MTLEERVAALEKLLGMSKGVTVPDGYYMSRYTGEETDTLLDKVANGEVGGGTAGVSSFNGRSGTVTPQSGDYTAQMVGAEPITEKGRGGGR